MYLKSAKLYDVVIQIPNEPDERWVDKDNTALVEIHNACEPDQQEMILDANYVKVA